MDGLETRELRYFVAIAEELHFGRAADRLGMAQPPLSRAIKQLERRLGVPLLERTSRRVQLTPAGQVLLREGRKALDAVTAAGQRTRRAGLDQPRLVLAMKAGVDGGLLPDIISGYRFEPDAVELDVLVCGVGEQAGLLRTGAADVSFLHIPHDDVSGFDTEVLREEIQVAVLPPDHKLADRDSVLLEDLRGERLPRWPGMPATPDSGPEVRDGGQLMQLIALGRTVAILPASVRNHLRRDLVCVPVLDAPHTRLVVAWPERSRSRAVAAFVRVAAAAAARASTAAAAPLESAPAPG
jgi:DNA-binding transcriptional LysR family regulator